MKDTKLFCSFCASSESEVEFLVEGENVYICDGCVNKASDIVNENMKKSYMGLSMNKQKPVDINRRLNEHIIGQEQAKRIVSVAVYNHFKRLNKTVRYLPPKDINYKKSYPCVGLIFIKYDANTEFECKEISKLETFQNLIPDSWISSIPENVTVFLDWFSELTCYQLTYSKNEFMIEKVKQLFENDL